MSDEEQLIEVFYTHFQQLDWRGMLNCYHEEVFFYDPVFLGLEGPQVRTMWEMLIGSTKDLAMSFSNVRLESGPGVPGPESALLKESYGSCQWVATYTFSQTGRRVVNKGTARFKFSGGKIIEHQDSYNLWKWCRQALGLPGILFGWTPVLQNQVRAMARKNLDKFMARSADSKR